MSNTGLPVVKISGFQAMIGPYKGLPREIYILFLSRVINSVGCFVQPLLALILTDKIGLGIDAAGIYITAQSMLSVPSLLIGGYLVDRIGRKKILIFSQSMGTIALISCGFLKPDITLVYILMLSSLLYAMSSPAYDAMLADLTSPQNRKGAYSLLYMGWNLGFSLGPIIGGFLYRNYLPLVFIGDGITAFISLLLVSFFVKETKRKKSETDIAEKEDRPLEKAVKGSVFRVLLQRPILLMFALILFCYQLVYSQLGFTLPLHVKELFPINGSFYFGLLGGFNGIIVITLTPLITKLTHSLKPIWVMAVGGLCYGVSFGMLAFVRALSLFFFSMFVLTVGEIMISINSGTFVAGHTPESHRGRVSSVLPLIYGAGFTFGPMMMGKVIIWRSISEGWMLIGAIGVLAGVFMALLQRWDNRQKQ